jgi:hypothetical protein
MHNEPKVKHTLLVLDVGGLRIGIRNFDGRPEQAVVRVTAALSRHNWLRPGQTPQVIAEKQIRESRRQA